MYDSAAALHIKCTACATCWKCILVLCLAVYMPLADQQTSTGKDAPSYKHLFRMDNKN